MSLPAPEESAARILKRLIEDPVGLLVRRWNWKAALLSSVWRGLVFAGLAARRGWWAAGAACGMEILLQTAAAGFSGAVTQAFHRVRPVWPGVVVPVALVLCIQHPLELALHLMRRTPHWRSGVLISIGYSVAATALSLAFMRRGFLLVGEESQTQNGELGRAAASLGGELQ